MAQVTGTVVLIERDLDFEWDGDCEEPKYPYQPYCVMQYTDGELTDTLGGFYMDELDFETILEIHEHGFRGPIVVTGA